MAKTRKGVRKGLKASAARKTGGKKKAAARRPAPKELDLGPLKKQIKDHVDRLSASKSTDRRVQAALSGLQRLQRELTRACSPTMTMPLA